MVHIDFGAFVVSGLWQRPSLVPQGGLVDVLSEAMIPAVQGGKPWLGIGDWNSTPEDNHFFNAGCHVLAAKEETVYTPTRWDGRAIDYGILMLSNRNLEATPFRSNVELGEEKVSDHKLVWVELQLKIPTCQQPLSTLRSTRSIGNHLMHPTPEETTAEEEWAAFNQAAERAQVAAIVACGGKAPSLGHHREKGSRPSFQQLDAASHASARDTTLKQRQLAKWSGRVWELRRRVSAQLTAGPLVRKVRSTWPPEVAYVENFTAHLGTLCHRAQEAMDALSRERRNTQLATWRRKMAAQGKACTTWLKQQCSPTPAAIRKQDGNITASLDEAFVELTTFWETVWNRNPACEELTRLREGNLDRGPPRPRQEWTLSAAELHQEARRKRGGAAGMDGWHGDEISSWPQTAWAIFYTLWLRWASRNSWPPQLTAYVFLFKVEESHQGVAAKDMRPISIQSVLARVVASSMAKQVAVQAWVKHIVSDDEHGVVAGRNVQTALLHLIERWEAGTFLVSLDLCKGFDFAHPQLALGILRHFGFPLQWERYFAHMWGCQQRWLQLGRHVQAEPKTVRTSLPQGDPFSPVAFVLLLEAAAKQFHRQPQLAGAQQTLFIDDRNAIARSAIQAWEVACFWRRWTARLGMHENVTKMRVVAKQAHDVAALHAAGFSHDGVVPQTRVLGVDFVQESAGEPRTLLQRIEEGRAILQRIGILPLALSAKSNLVRTRVVPKMVWGRFMHNIPAEESRKLGAAIKFAIRGHRQGARALWELLQGHWVNPRFKAAQDSFASLARAQHFWLSHGQGLVGGAWYSMMCEALYSLGFQQIPGGFTSQQHGTNIQWPFRQHFGSFDQWLKRALHDLRETWRRAQFAAFLEKDRRDSRQLRGQVAYQEAVVTKARYCYNSSNQSMRACMVGAGLSVCCYSKMRGEGMPTACRFCEQPVTPNWEHLLWECSAFSNTRPVVPAAEALCRRLGWPRLGTTSAEDFAVLRHCAQVREIGRASDGFHHQLAPGEHNA